MTKIIDLTLEIKMGMLTFPSSWHPKVEIIKLGSHESVGRETSKIVLGSHTGTHIDAPRHFIKGADSIDKINLEYLVGKAVVADFSLVRSAIGPKDLALKCGKAKFDKIKRLIIYTGWSSKWGMKNYYTGYPFLSEDACDWILQRGIKVLGMDTPSPDDPINSRSSGNDSPNHKKFLESGVILIEYLTNLKKLLNKKFTLIAMPLRLAGCDGSPARVVAIIE